MRIRNITISKWRHFENIELRLDQDSSLVCIVGANGTGKSHILELISACAFKLGLSPGIEIPRGDPFADPHDFSLQFFLAKGVSDAVDEGLVEAPSFQEWDRTLTIRDGNLPDRTLSIIEAGGIADQSQRIDFARRVISCLRESKEVYFLSLDADRAYPKRAIHVNEIAQAYEIDWEGLEYTRGRSFRTTTTLYDEWIKYFLAQENQTGTKLIQEMRRAKKYGTSLPSFEDHFEGYASSLQKVLPHVLFTGVNAKQRTLLFDTTGLELSFSQLSGGEREIAFLIGQIDRFGLRQGLFLLDEPELHLNADLIRTWVSYLTSTMSTGQVWLATHSLEAVEAAGQKSTFVLERNYDTRKVENAARLDSRPILSALSRALGTPAFSISQLRFVFIEGEDAVGEQERFRKLLAASPDLRFITCGPCNEVYRRVSAVRSLADQTATGIRIGGIIDRDFRSDAEVHDLEDRHAIRVLPVHEVENIFLCPSTVSVLLGQNGRNDAEPENLIRELADSRAGAWVFQYALAARNADDRSKVSIAAKNQAKVATWQQLVDGGESVISSIVDNSGLIEQDKERFRNILKIGISAYAKVRTKPELWKICEGKQILSGLARSCGFADPTTMEQATFAAWEQGVAPIPTEVSELREYVNHL